MKNLNIGENILFFRKKNNLTQEGLANKIGITAGAVSKWEHGNSTPDIALLSPLAKALNVTIDELFSFKQEISEEEVSSLKKDLAGIFLIEGYKKGEEKCKEFLLEHPNSLHLKLAIGGLIQMYSSLGSIEETVVKERLGYALELYYEVSKKKDFKYSNIAFECIASLEMMLENYDKSEEAIKNINAISIEPLFLYTVLLEKKGEVEEAKNIAKKLLMKYLSETSAMLSVLGRLNKDDINKAKIYLNTLTDIESKFNIGMGAGAYQFAKIYLENDNRELAAKWHKKYIDEIISAPYDYKENPFFEGVLLEVDREGQKIVRKSLMKNLLKSDEFNELKGNKDYEESLEVLKLAIDKI